MVDTPRGYLEDCKRFKKLLQVWFVFRSSRENEPQKKESIAMNGYIWNRRRLAMKANKKRMRKCTSRIR
jgi:hypothetical protein